MGKKILHRLKKILQNWVLKLISLVIAFLLWFLVVSTDNPKETQVYYNIPVTLLNVGLLEQENKVYEVLDNTDVVRVSVRAPRNVFGQLRASDIVAEADMSKLTELNTIAINCSVPNFEVESLTANPELIRLSIEEKRSRWINVRSSVTGAAAEGYAITSTVLDQNRIEVSGPKSLVDILSYAGIEVDVTGATTTQSANAEINLYDADGRPIEAASLKKSAEYIRMSVEVLPVKEVPVELNFTGTPADGYLATGRTECSLPTVQIAGPSGILSNVTKISIPETELNIADATGDLEKSINLKEYLPSGIKFADPNFNGKASATVFVEKKMKSTLSIPETGIAILNLPEELTFRFEEEHDPYRLTVSGLREKIQAIGGQDIKCHVDVERWMREKEIKRLVPGVYEFPVEVTLPEGVTAESELSVNIIIEKAEEE